MWVVEGDADYFASILEWENLLNIGQGGKDRRPISPTFDHSSGTGRG
jgi:hypothetical protein